MKPTRLRNKVVVRIVKDVRDIVVQVVNRVYVLEENLLRSMITVDNVNYVKKSN